MHSEAQRGDLSNCCYLRQSYKHSAAEDIELGSAYKSSAYNGVIRSPLIPLPNLCPDSGNIRQKGPDKKDYRHGRQSWRSVPCAGGAGHADPKAQG